MKAISENKEISEEAILEFEELEIAEELGTAGNNVLSVIADSVTLGSIMGMYITLT
ncbi:hypothetical protein [Butyrivibrio sp. YAB3001]|uniref:hypothetical protein n=1 Tax=Butyrivibrio sp. YAB3001 TaxID=1520812 RepID=UPI0008F6385A|nr:hypothetical protein [Butyrivibrio sp. YAB3001]SFC02209.1 hypothetical protein SAMN02910398_01343 [Butyrivibrio sp. YAB3001]